MANLLFLLLGLLVGFWGWTIYQKLEEVLKALKDRREYEKAGIVRPQVKSIPRVDLSTPTGGVRRPSPDEYLIANMKDREEKLKRVS